MLPGEFSAVFANEVDRLDMFFHREIRKAKINDNIEHLKKDLMQDTALAVLLKIRQPKYQYFNPQALIWLKAKDVWAKYIHEHSLLPKINISLEEIGELYHSIDVATNLENADYLHQVRKIVDQNSWDLISLHVDGYPYAKLAKQYDTSIAAVKMKILRLRNKLGGDQSF